MLRGDVSFRGDRGRFGLNFRRAAGSILGWTRGSVGVAAAVVGGRCFCGWRVAIILLRSLGCSCLASFHRFGSGATIRIRRSVLRYVRCVSSDTTLRRAEMQSAAARRAFAFAAEVEGFVCTALAKRVALRITGLLRCCQQNVVVLCLRRRCLRRLFPSFLSHGTHIPLSSIERNLPTIS